jgi:hypothetical protein
MDYQDKLKKDFRLVLWIIWKHLNLPQPTPIQYDIALYLQHGPRRKIIEAFRGVGKSWVTAAYVIWRLLCNPQYKIMVVSASKERADAFAIFVKKLINEIPEFSHLKARAGQRDTMIAFDVGPSTPDQSPSVKSVGITGQLTGSRADEIIGDDIEVPSNSATQMQRDKLSELVKEFDAVLKPGGNITYLGTPQTEMSLYNILPQRGYEIRIWPALYPNEKQVMAYGDRLAPYIRDKLAKGAVVGKTTEPARFTDVDLGERLASYGRAGFALQFMLDTSLSDADRYPLKANDLIVMNLNPEMAHMQIVWAASPELVINDLPNVALNGDRFHRPMWHDDTMSKYTGAVMVIDPSGRGKDETAYSVVKCLNGQLFLMAVGGFTTGYTPETLQALAMIGKKHGVKHVLIEANFGDGMFTELIKPVFTKAGYPVTIEEVKHSKQKELRIIDTMEPILMQHKLVIDQKVIQEDYETALDNDGQHDQRRSFIYQMSRVTRERGALLHDDRLDAVAMAVAYWVEAMARDVEKGLRSHKDKLLDLELKKFMTQLVVGKKPGKKGFLASNRALSR